MKVNTWSSRKSNKDRNTKAQRENMPQHLGVSTFGSIAYPLKLYPGF